MFDFEAVSLAQLVLLPKEWESNMQIGVMGLNNGEPTNLGLMLDENPLPPPTRKVPKSPDLLLGFEMNLQAQSGTVMVEVLEALIGTDSLTSPIGRGDLQRRYNSHPWGDLLSTNHRSQIVRRLSIGA